MKHCSKCGATIESDDLKFCPQCGNAVQEGAEVPVSKPAAPSGGMEDNIAGLLCYIAGFITGIIFLVIEPYNRKPFVRFHAFQSIFFNVAAVILMIVLGILGVVFAFIGLAGIFFPINMLIWLGILALWIVLMVKAYQKQKWLLPIIGGLAEKQANPEN